MKNIDPPRSHSSDWSPSSPPDPSGSDLTPSIIESRLYPLAVGVVVVVSLYVARSILIPVALAVLLSFMLAPLVRQLRRARIGRVPAVIVAVMLTLGIILSLGGVIGSQISEIVREIPRYTVTIEGKITKARVLVAEHFLASLGPLGQRLQHASTEPELPTPNETGRKLPADQSGPTPAKPLPVEVHQPDPTPFEMMERILSPVVGPLATTGIVFIVAIFILLQQMDLRDRFIRLFGLGDQHRTNAVLGDVGQRLSRFLLTVLALNVTFGIMIGLGVWMLGLPNPLLWATLAALCRFVPYVGSLTAGLLPTAFAAAIDPGWGLAIWTASLFVVSETIMGQLIDPLAFGHSTGLSPVSVIVATIFWSWLWGPIGLILAMPLTVCLVVLGRHFPGLAFLDILMGASPALTPVEGLYQRLLANDLDETLNFTEGYLKDHSTTSCYDDVMIPSLRLAVHDAERGVLTLGQMARIQWTIARMLKELATDSAPTAEPKPEPEPALVVADVPGTSQAAQVIADVILPAQAPPDKLRKVLCIAGPGVLDAPVAAMLAQLLNQQAIPAETVNSASVSREEIASLDKTDIAFTCIACLDPGSSPSYFRYLLRRIRGRLPEVPVLVGIWTQDDPTDTRDERGRGVIEADFYAGSLLETVGICVGALREHRVAVPTDGVA